MGIQRKRTAPDIMAIDMGLIDDSAEPLSSKGTLGECINDVFGMIASGEIENVAVCYYVTLNNRYAIYLPEHMRKIETNLLRS